MNNGHDAEMAELNTAAIWKLLLKYSIPSMLGLFAIAFYETIDRVFIGQFVGDDGLAVMTIGMPFVIFLGACCIMFRVGATSMISRSLGKGELADAARALGNAAALLLAAGVVVAMIAAVFAQQLARLGGGEDEFMRAAAAYIRIIAVGAPLLFISNAANALMRATGSPRKGLLLIVMSCAANVVLDAVFVAWLGWGVPGAAWATVIAQGMGALYGVLYFTKPGALVRLTINNFRLDTALVREMIGVGFAYAMFEINFMIVVTITNNMLESYGNAMALAGIAVVNSCVTLLYTPMTGLDEGIQPVLGYNFGAKNHGRVRRIAAYSLTAGLVFFTVSFMIIQLRAEAIVALFVKTNPEFIASTARALRITFALAPLMAFMIIVPGILSALGEVRFNVILSTGIQWAVQIPALLILPRFFGVDGVWLSFPLVDIVASVAAVLFIFKAFKRHGLLLS